MTTLPIQIQWTVEQGSRFQASYRWVVNGTNQNLSDWAARCVARPSLDSKYTIFDLTEASGTAGNVALGSDGLITVTIHGPFTAGMSGTAIADLVLTDSTGETIRFLRAKVTVDQAVIR
jgi:hypothetical protein